MPLATVCSKIVVPFDGSELSKKALKTAKSLLEQDEKIELDVITVVKIPMINYLQDYSGMQIHRIREAYLAAAKEELDEISHTLEGVPNQIRTRVLEGNPSDAILQFIKQNHIDLVVMGSRGLNNLEEMFLGSVSHYVVQKSPCPVYIVK